MQNSGKTPPLRSTLGNRHALSAPNIGWDNPAPGDGLRNTPGHLFTFGCCRLGASEPQSSLGLVADAPADTPFCRRNEQGVKGLPHPRVHSRRDEVTASRTSTHRTHRKVQTEVFAGADVWQPLGASALFSDLSTAVFFLVLFEARHPPLLHRPRWTEERLAIHLEAGKVSKWHLRLEKKRKDREGKSSPGL